MKSRTKKILKSVLIVFLVIILLMGITLTYIAYRIGQDINRHYFPNGAPHPAMLQDRIEKSP